MIRKILLTGMVLSLMINTYANAEETNMVSENQVSANEVQVVSENFAGEGISENSIEVPDNSVSNDSIIESDVTEEPEENLIEKFTVSSNGDGVYIFGRTYKEFDIDEYRKERQAQQTNYLTETQIEDGWILYDGWAYPPNSTEVESIGDYIRGNEDDDTAIYGQVVFYADVEPGINQDAFITIMNASTYEEYTLDLSPNSGYSRTIEMPVDTYLIVDGGLYDYSSPTICSQSNFKVLKNSISQVKVAIRSRDYLMKYGNDDIVSANKAANEEFTIQIAEEQKEQNEEAFNTNQDGNSSPFSWLTGGSKEESPTTTFINSEKKTQKGSGLPFIGCVICLIAGFAGGRYLGKKKED